MKKKIKRRSEGCYSSRYKITACSTGIAHTFMAAKALRQAGEKLHISIKVETNGQERG